MEKDLLKDIDDSIERLSLFLRSESDDEAYTNAVSGMKALVEARESILKERNSKSWLRPDLLVPICGTLVEILLVMNHERLNVISTKIWPRIGK